MKTMKNKDKLSYGCSRTDNSEKCDDIYYLFIGSTGLGYYTIRWSEAYWGSDGGVHSDEEFVGIAHKGEEVALVQTHLGYSNYVDPMRVCPADARDASVRKEWLEDLFGSLQFCKDNGYDFCEKNPELVKSEDIELYTEVYKIGDRDYFEEYWDKK